MIFNYLPLWYVVDSIKKAVENASRNLGVVVKRVLLVVPGVHTKRINRQLRIPITGRISESDVRRAYNELAKAQYPEGYILTNILMSKFFVNGRQYYIIYKLNFFNRNEAKITEISNTPVSY